MRVVFVLDCDVPETGVDLLMRRVHRAVGDAVPIAQRKRLEVCIEDSADAVMQVITASTT